MVSMTDRHLAVMTFEVTLLDGDAPVAISSQLLNRQDGEDEYHVRAAAMGQGTDPRKSATFERRVLTPAVHRRRGRQRPDDPGLPLRRVGDDDRGRPSTTSSRPATSLSSNTQFGDDVSRMTYRVDARQGVPIRLVKYAAYHTSRGVPARELVSRCRRTLDRALATGLDGQRRAPAGVVRRLLGALRRRGRRDRPRCSRRCAGTSSSSRRPVGRAEGAGVPAKGVTGSGYSGHYFWDTEIYTLPFFTYTTPQLHPLGAAVPLRAAAPRPGCAPSR